MKRERRSRYRGKDSLAVSAVICSRAGGCAPSGMPVGIRICHARSGWVGRSCLPAMMRARGVLHARMSWSARGKVSGLSDDAWLCVRMGSRPGRIRRIGKKRPPYRDAEKNGKSYRIQVWVDRAVSGRPSSGGTEENGMRRYLPDIKPGLSACNLSVKSRKRHRHPPAVPRSNRS